MILLVAIIMIFLIVTIQIFNIIGYVNITKFAFDSKDDKDNRTIMLTKNQMNFIKLSVVLQIISILFVFISFLAGKSPSLLVFQVAFYILYAIGLFFITKFAFSSKNFGDMRSIKLTDNEMIFVKITSVMQWISIGFVVLALVGAILGFAIFSKPI